MDHGQMASNSTTNNNMASDSTSNSTASSCAANEDNGLWHVIANQGSRKILAGVNRFAGSTLVHIRK